MKAEKQISNCENLITLADGTNIFDLNYGDLLKHVNDGNYAIVDRVLDDCVSTVSGSIPFSWINNWKIVQHDVL